MFKTSETFKSKRRARSLKRKANRSVMKRSRKIRWADKMRRKTQTRATSKKYKKKIKYININKLQKYFNSQKDDSK